MDRIITEEEKQFLEPVVKVWLERKLTWQEEYEKFAAIYDQSADILGLSLHHKKFVTFLCSFVPAKDLKDKLIIDIACGTGLLGVELAKLGRTNMHGLDFSKPMLEESKKKNVYSKYLHVALTATNQIPGVSESMYDVAVSTSAFDTGQLPVDVVREISRIVKPNGYIILSLSYNDTEFMGTLGGLMRENLVSLEKMERFPFNRDPIKNYGLFEDYGIMRSSLLRK